MCQCRWIPRTHGQRSTAEPPLAGRVARHAVRVGDVQLYFDVAGMGLIPDGPVMRERPVIVCLHGGPALTTVRSSLISCLWPSRLSSCSMTTAGRGAVIRADRNAGTSTRGSTIFERSAGRSGSSGPSCSDNRLAASSHWSCYPLSRPAFEADRLEQHREIQARPRPADVRAARRGARAEGRGAVLSRSGSRAFR